MNMFSERISKTAPIRDFLPAKQKATPSEIVYYPSNLSVTDFCNRDNSTTQTNYKNIEKLIRMPQNNRPQPNQPRPQPPPRPSKKSKNHAPVNQQKNQPKSYYSYPNTKKFKNGRF